MTSTMHAPPVDASPSNSSSRRRRLVPRFGLRTLFVFAILFCLFFGWIGRNYYRLRQEEAAIEALMQAGATIYVKADDGIAHHPATPVQYTMQFPGNAEEEDWYGRLFGYSDRLVPQHVELGTRNREPDEATVRAAIDALAVFDEIESVEMAGSAFDNESLASLARLPALQGVGLRGTSVDGRGLASLGLPARIRHFGAGGNAAPDLLSGLASLSELESVSLVKVEASPSDLETIVRLPQLRELHLVPLSPAKPEFFQPLAKASMLRSLSIRFDESTLDGIRCNEELASSISQLDRLEELIIDQFADEGLADLGPMPALRWLHVGRPATPEGARAFSESHSDCLVHWFPLPDEKWYRRGKSVEPPPEELRYRPFDK